VLERPEVPLHTHGSERDIREPVIRKKISGGTRSDRGRPCRDTCLSLKKTCRKLGLSFWHSLLDRIQGDQAIPPWPALIRPRANSLAEQSGYQGFLRSDIIPTKIVLPINIDLKHVDDAKNIVSYRGI
jgi:hypothetical protein